MILIYMYWAQCVNKAHAAEYPVCPLICMHVAGTSINRLVVLSPDT